MANLLDEIVGASKLPHVYCRKITVENSVSSYDPTAGPGGLVGASVHGSKFAQEQFLNATKVVSITLNLVLYEKVSADDNSSNWLKQISDTTKLNDMVKYMYLHVQPVTNLDYLKPNVLRSKGYDPATVSAVEKEMSIESHGSVYSVDTLARKNFLGTKNLLNTWYPWHNGAGKEHVPGETYSPGSGGYINSHLGSVSAIFYPVDPALCAASEECDDVGPDTGIPDDWDLGFLDALSGWGHDKATGASCKLTDYISDFKLLPIETLDGKPYYALPITCKFDFPIKFTGESAAGWATKTANLGFMFYTWLHPKSLLEDKFGELVDLGMISEFLNESKLRGPINTEIVYENSKLAQKRQDFFLPGGKRWEGSVHLHLPKINPTPDGYHGLGGLGTNTGWMTGEKHSAVPQQHKLTLAEVPNHKIDDFTTESALTDEGAAIPGSTFAPNLTLSKQAQWSTDTGAYIADVISPLQKETRKYLLKDNENEYSRLFLTRGTNGQAKGVFYIDYENFLTNNSNLFSRMALNNNFIKKAINYSRLLELKVFRNRVKRHNPDVKNQEIFKNDSLFEEPPTLVASIGTVQTANVGDLLAGGAFSDITLPYQTIFGDIEKINGFGPVADDNLFKYACFAFTDASASELKAGRYEYSIEIKFKDGTYQLLQERLRDLTELDQELRRYYELSKGHFSQESAVNFGPHPGGLAWNTHNSTYEDRKKVFTPWYNKNLGFHSDFEDYVTNIFHHPHLDQTKYQALDGEEYRLWEFIPIAIDDTLAGLFNVNVTGCITKLYGVCVVPGKAFLTATTISMANPTHGSPAGIEFFIKILSAIINELENLVGLTKIKFSGGELTSNKLSSGWAQNQEASPTEPIIYEFHSFDETESLYIATNLNSIWANYLDYDLVGSIEDTIAPSVKILDVETYIHRCNLEVKKYTSIPNPAAWSPPPPLYSNLGPSFARCRFHGGQQTYLISSFNESGTGLDSAFGPGPVYPKFLYTLSAYHLERKNTEYADIIEPLPRADLGSYRGAAKNYIEKFNITVHSKERYLKFFDKLAGAPHVTTQHFEEYKDTGLKDEKYFSDGDLRVERFIADYTMGTPQEISRVPRGKLFTSSGTTGMYFYSMEGLTTGGPGHATFKNLIQAYGYYDQLTPHSSLHDQYYEASAFIFFHMNLVKLVQWYTVSPSDPRYGSWNNVDQAFLSQMETGRKFLCRLGSAMGGMFPATTEDISLPVLDQYFFIAKG